MDGKELKGLIAFLHEAEGLKVLLRHSWLSSGRQESVAEHSWRMAIMAIVIYPHLEHPMDLPKVLKMVLVHDLCEIHYKDNWAFNKAPADKEEQERKSLIKLLKPLSKDMKSELIELWEEFEAAKTPEALFAKFLDKNEVLLQHDEADVKFLHKQEIPLNLHYGEQFGAHDPFLTAFRKAVNKETIEVYKKNKIDETLYKDYV